MITFDEKGHVYPYEVIEFTLEEFERIFVEGLEDKSHRRNLFSKYLQFNDDLKKALNIPYFQWINGSFTTQKLFPGDVDIVSFIDYDYFIRNGRFFNHLAQNSQELYKVDAHFGTTASWRHRFYERTTNDDKYWRDVYGFSRRDENLVRHPKGIIKIKFQ